MPDSTGLPPLPPGFTLDTASAPVGPITLGTPHPDKPPLGYEADPATPGHLRPIPGGPNDPGKDAPTIGVSEASGDAYLKTLDQPTAAMVKALAEGRKAFPTGAGLRAPYWQNLLQHVSNYDPGFDEVNYTSRSATRKDFTSGKAANNIRALNTAIGHLGHLEEQIPGTASHGFTPLNALENTGRRLMGDAGPTNFDTTVSALAGELTAVYRGAGGAEADINRYIQQLSPNASEAQKTGAIKNIAGLLKSRLDALNDQYRQGMGTTAQQLQLLDPQAQLIVQHLGGFDAAGAPQDKSDPSAPALGGGLPPAGPSGGAPPTGPDVNPIVNGGAGHYGTTITPSNGETRAVIDPKKQALGQQIVALVERGADPNTVMGYAVGRDPSLRSDHVFRAWVIDAAKRRQEHPNIKFSIRPDFYTTEVPLSTTEKVGNAVAQSAPGAALMEAGNAATFGNLGSVLGDREGTDRALNVAEAQHPYASVAGTVGGGAAAAMGLEGLLGKVGGMAAGPARSLLADAAYGGITGGTNAPEGKGLQNAALGAMLGLGGSAVGRGLTKGVAAGLEGVTNPSVSYAAREMPGALTIGQAVGQSGRVGKAVKGIEDNLSGLPIVGDAINARRSEGLQRMNSVAFDKALEPIGGKAGGKFGEEAVQHAQEQVSNAYNQALAGKSTHLDFDFIKDGAKAKLAIEKLPESVGKDVETLIDGVMNDHFSDTGQLTGEGLQSALRELAQIKSSYSGSPAGHRIGKVVDDFSASIEGLFKRQAPEVMPQYNAAKTAYRRLSILADAVNKAKNETDGKSQVFTPAQLGLADRANGVKYDGKINTAAGDSPFHDFHKNMQAVLPNKVPNSGTAGRLLVPAALIGAGGGGGALEGDTGKGLTLGALLSLAYSKTGQRALTAAVLKRGTASQAAGQVVRKSARVVGHAAASDAALGSSRD